MTERPTTDPYPKMTAGQLIERLQLVPPDTLVSVECGEYTDPARVTRIIWDDEKDGKNQPIFIITGY